MNGNVHSHTYAYTDLETRRVEDLSFSAVVVRQFIRQRELHGRSGGKQVGKSAKEGRGENGCGCGPQARPLIASRPARTCSRVDFGFAACKHAALPLNYVLD